MFVFHIPSLHLNLIFFSLVAQLCHTFDVYDCSLVFLLSFVHKIFFTNFTSTSKKIIYSVMFLKVNIFILYISDGVKK